MRAAVSAGSRPVSNVKSWIASAFLAIASRMTMSSAPKLHANAVGDWFRSIRSRFEISSRVLRPRSITTLTSYDAGDADHQKDTSENTAQYDLWQPAADVDSNVETRD